MLLTYFRKKETCSETHAQLPDPCGSIGQEVGKSLTEEANKEVSLVLENSTSLSTTKQREPYLKLTQQQKSTVANYAAENGAVAAIRRFSKEFGSTLKESTIRGWKKAYLQELHARKKSGESIVINVLEEKRMGAL